MIEINLLRLKKKLNDQEAKKLFIEKYRQILDDLKKVDDSLNKISMKLSKIVL